VKLSKLITFLISAPKQKMEVLLPDGRIIPSHCHLTEVAHVQKNFIDCGGELRQVEFCTLQLWATFDIGHRLTTDKFLSILSKSGKVLPFQDIQAEVEYEDKVISQYPIESVQRMNGKVVIQLKNKHTDCLAKDACGVNPAKAQPGCSSGNECC
jgi:hypothetical protein